MSGPKQENTYKARNWKHIEPINQATPKHENTYEQDGAQVALPALVVKRTRLYEATIRNEIDPPIP